MSSYIPSNIHFNSAERAVKALITTKDFYTTKAIREAFPVLADYHSLPKQKEEAVSVIFFTLRRLTVLCVSLQYRHHYVGTLDKEICQQMGELVSDRKSHKILNTYGLLSGLKCINYQIESRHLSDIRDLTEEENNALLFLNEMISAVALYIVEHSEEYKKQKWGI